MGGSKGGGSQLVGYAYFLDMAYAFSEKIDHFYSFYLQENKVWSGDITSGGSTVSLKTGTNAETYGSNSGDSVVTIYTGTQISPDAYLSGRTGVSLNYKNVCYFIFKQAFIGDNVRTVPTYGVLVGRTSIDTCSHLTNYATHKNITGSSTVISNGTAALPTTVASVSELTDLLVSSSGIMTYAVTNANPAYIIYDILAGLLKVPKIKLDDASFIAAASTLYTEKLGLSMVINTSKKGIDWIEEILRYIQGVVYFNSTTGKYSLKLFRDDYNAEDLITVDIDIASDIKFTRSSRADLPNTFTFKYQNITGTGIPKEDSMSITNQANYESAGYIKNVDVDLTCINTDEALALLTTTNFKKMSYPLATISFKISPLDFPDFTLGSVFNFVDDILTGGAGIVFRVTKVTGDSSKDEYFGVEAIEDIFSVGEIIDVPSSIPISVQPEYTLTSAPNRIKIIPTTPENAVAKSVFVAATYPNNGAYLRNLMAYEVDTLILPTSEWSYGTVTAITNNSDTVVDRNLIIRVENLDKDLYPIVGTEQDLQRCVYTAYWGDEAIAFKTCAKISDTIFEFSGILRGIQDKTTSHSVGETFWVAPTSGKDLPVLPIVSNTTTIHVYGENNYGTSPEITTSYTYNYEIETPYSPNSLSIVEGGGPTTLQWSPRVRLRGANYRNCDTLFAGEDEGMVEGIFNLYKDNVLINTFYPTTNEKWMTHVITQTGTYAVDCQINTYKSPKKTITVTTII